MSHQFTENRSRVTSREREEDFIDGSCTGTARYHSSAIFTTPIVSDMYQI